MPIGQQLDLSLQSAIITYGPMALFLFWMMFRAEKRLDVLSERIGKASETIGETHKDVIVEVRTLSHRIHGMSKAMLMDVLTRQNASEVVKQTAQEMLNANGDRHEQT